MSSTMEAAERFLEERLKKSFGPDLEGVVVFGPRWDPEAQEDFLRVVVDDATTPEPVVRSLPQKIGRYDVRVSRAGMVVR